MLMNHKNQRHLATWRKGRGCSRCGLRRLMELPNSHPQKRRHADRPREQKQSTRKDPSEVRGHAEVTGRLEGKS